MRKKINFGELVYFYNYYPDYEELNYNLGIVVGIGRIFCIVKHKKDNKILYSKVCKYKLYKTNYKIKKGIIEI